MNSIDTTYTHKLYFKKYQYRIKFKRLHRFPNLERLGIPASRWEEWWGERLPTEEDREQRLACLEAIIDSGVERKVSTSTYTFVYLTNEDDYNVVKDICPEYQIERTEPSRSDLLELQDKYPSTTEFKKALYFKKYRYKVTLRYSDHFRDHLARQILDIFKDSEHIRLDKKISSMLDPHTYGFSPWRFHYAEYNVYCESEEDISYFSFIASESITSVKKAILFSELDK